MIPEGEKSEKVLEKSKPKKQISQDNLYQQYEKENPKKKAIWRGKETKGFLEWKIIYLGNDDKEK